MKVTAIELTSWRNYEAQHVVMNSSPSVFVGENGQGKTNLVEAIVYAALGRSHRTHRDATLVAAGQPQAFVRMRVANNERKIDIDLAVTASGANTLRINGNPAKKGEVARMFPLVIFAPEDLDLVRGEPDRRRQYLDDIVHEISREGTNDLAEFDRILRQRNSLLKSLRTTPNSAELTTLDTWTDALVDSGARVMVMRRGVVDQLLPAVTRHYSAIAGNSDSAVIHLEESIPPLTPDAAIPAVLREMFHVKRRDEIDRGTTLAGPQRDDLVLSLNNMPARTHSSQGEAWSFALALRLAMKDVVTKHSIAGDPVVILDDVFSELDEGRRLRLGEHLVGIEHVIVTAADDATLPVSLSGERFRVREGRVYAE
jgi:DNA replication and repair protein RecF